MECGLGDPAPAEALAARLLSCERTAWRTPFSRRRIGTYEAVRRPGNLRILCASLRRIAHPTAVKAAEHAVSPD